MTHYVRKNAWNDGGDFSNQELLWYARGVQKMMSRPLNDPASWWFFGAIHKRLSSATEEAPTTHVYLTLENIQGTHDASVLRVFLRLPETANAIVDPPRDFRAGSVGLYGLRRASEGRAGNSEGLQFVLDITPFFKDLNLESPALAEEIIVSIRPHRELPAGTTVVVGGIRISRKDYAVGDPWCDRG